MSIDPAPPPARGDMTREALIQAAIEAFGRSGFDAASTRAIATAAGVNQALIGYHFRGKPGLYLAALQHIAAAVQQRMGPLVATISAELGLLPRHPGLHGELEPRRRGGERQRRAAVEDLDREAVDPRQRDVVALERVEGELTQGIGAHHRSGETPTHEHGRGLLHRRS